MWNKNGEMKRVFEAGWKNNSDSNDHNNVSKNALFTMFHTCFDELHRHYLI